MEERSQRAPSERLQAFLNALPSVHDEAFVSPPGLGGTWRAKHIRRGLERKVLVSHWTGFGLCILQPREHGVCPDCARDRRSICEHCNCAMCGWFRMTEERSSPLVSRERFELLVARMKALRLGGAAAKPKPDLLEDVG